MVATLCLHARAGRGGAGGRFSLCCDHAQCVERNGPVFAGGGRDCCDVWMVVHTPLLAGAAAEAEAARVATRLDVEVAKVIDSYPERERQRWTYAHSFELTQTSTRWRVLVMIPESDDWTKVGLVRSTAVWGEGVTSVSIGLRTDSGVVDRVD